MMTSSEPIVKPKDRYPIGEAAKVLGIDRKTLLSYAMLGKRNGGIDCHIGRNGRKVFNGAELKRFWLAYWG